MPNIYTCFCTDVIHEGHLRILSEAQKYGELTVGVLRDSEMVRYNRFPVKSTEERVAMVETLPGVSRVIVQNAIMYDDVIRDLHPDYVIHGDNWDQPALAAIRENIVSLLSTYRGKLIEVPYTRNEEVAKINRRMREQLAMPEFRRSRLRKLLGMVPIVKTMEVHSGLTAYRLKALSW